MKLAKILVIIGIVSIVCIGYLMTSGDDPVTQQYVIQQHTIESKSRGDDETYADELRSIVALHEESSIKNEQEIKDLKKQLSAVDRFIKKQEEITKKETQNRIDQINNLISETNKQIKNLTAEQLLDRQKLQEELLKLESGIITMDQFNSDETIQNIIKRNETIKKTGGEARFFK